MAPMPQQTSDTRDDPQLIERIASGDRLAMQVLYNRHRVRVFRFILRFVRDEAGAEDILAEVFFDVWRQAGKFEGRASVSTWLLSIARFKALSQVRSDPRRRGDAPYDEEAAAEIADE